MAAVQEVICAFNDGAVTVTLTYDDVTLAWQSITATNNGATAYTFKASIDGTQRSWSFTLAAGQTVTHAVPGNITLDFIQDPTVLSLSQNGFTVVTAPQ